MDGKCSGAQCPLVRTEKRTGCESRRKTKNACPPSRPSPLFCHSNMTSSWLRLTFLGRASLLCLGWAQVREWKTVSFIYSFLSSFCTFSIPSSLSLVLKAWQLVKNFIFFLHTGEGGKCASPALINSIICKSSQLYVQCYSE